jgi:tetratricopeptide (TPR) repeat protein
MLPTILLISCVLALQSPAESPEDRLLKAELLEVSTGDLEKAMAVYQEILADEKAPAAVRARAKLYLARCQRKRGELDAARKNLEEVARDPADREVARQAAGFLKELKEGRAQNPDFDWLKEMEKSPEIQARVFELVMDLVDPATEKGQRARRQLLAMGTLALPVVERVLETSRDPIHRLQLALIAMRAGRFERVAVLLDPAQRIDANWNGIYQEFGWFLDTIKYFSDDERKRLLETVTRRPPSPATGPYADAIQLAAGDFSDLPRKLKAIENTGLLDQSRLFWILESNPPAAQEMAARILDPEPWVGTRARYLEALLMKSPASVGKEHFKVLEELARSGNDPNPSIRGFIPALESRGDFDLLGRLASIESASKSILQYFNEKYRSDATLAEAPAEWAPVLRKVPGAMGALSLLQRLAEAKDEAVPEFAAMLGEVRGLLGFRKRSDRNWRPSPRYAEAMAGLLSSRDPFVLETALEALALAPKGVGPEILPALERLALSPPDLHVREFALYALLHRFSSRPETGPEVARILLADHAKNSSTTVNVNNPYGPLGNIEHAHGSGSRKGYDDSILGWVLDAIPRGTLLSLLPPVLSAGGGENKPQLTTWLYSHLPQPEGDRTILSLLDWPTLIEKDDPILDNVGQDDFGRLFESWVQGLPDQERDRIYLKLRTTHRPRLIAWLFSHYPKDRPDYQSLIETALADTTAIVRDLAVRAALNSRKEIKPALLFRLLDLQEGRTDDVFKAIEDLASPDSIPPLVKLLDDPDASVRQMALKTLNAIRTQLEEKKQWQDIMRARQPGPTSP